MGNKSVTPLSVVEKEKMDKSMHLLGRMCRVCGYFDFKYHRTIDDCIRFIESELQHMESGLTLMIPYVAKHQILRLKDDRDTLLAVKKGIESNKSVTPLSDVEEEIKQ